MRPWKVQKIFGDVVYDLRNRGLLPVVGLLVVAMVAVPILISRGGGGSSSSSSPMQATSAASKPAPEGERAVVAYSPPGVRNYKLRLNDQTAKDPFRQQFAHSAATASKVTSTATIPTASGGSTGTVATGTGSTSTGTVSGSSGDATKKKKKKVTYKVNLLAGDATTTLTPFDDVQPLAPLPSQATTVLLYYGLTSDHGSAQFLVSNRVDAVTGSGSCIPAPDDCALLTVPKGQSEDLHYTTDGKTYRVVVAQIKSVKK